MAANEQRRLTITINGREIANNIKAIEKEFHKVRNELKKATIGSEEYRQKMAEMKRLKGILDGHRKDVGMMKGVWAGFGNMLRTQLAPLLAIGTIFNIIRDGINTIKEFGQAQANLASVLGKTREEIKALEEDAKRLGAATSFTATEVSQLQTEYAKLGFSEQEILNVTEATLSLAAATGSDLAEAASVAGATLRTFGLNSSEMQRVVDVMAKSFSSSALDLEKFKESMKTAAPLAKAAGVSIEETTAMLGKLADSGISGSLAGTALKAVFNELTKSGKPLAEALEDVKAELDAAGSPAERLAIANDLVGERGQAALLVLANQTQGIRELTGALQDAGGAAEAMANTQLNTLDGRLKILSSAWDGLILQFSDGEGVMMAVVRAATAVVDAFSAIIVEIKGNFGLIGDAFADLGESLGLTEQKGAAVDVVFRYLTFSLRMFFMPLQLTLGVLASMVQAFNLLVESGKIAAQFIANGFSTNGIAGALDTSKIAAATDKLLSTVQKVGEGAIDPFKDLFGFGEEQQQTVKKGAAAAIKSFGEMSRTELEAELKKTNDLLANQYISPELKAQLLQKINDLNNELANRRIKPVAEEEAQRVKDVVSDRVQRIDPAKIREVEQLTNEIVQEEFAKSLEVMAREEDRWMDEQAKKDKDFQEQRRQARLEIFESALGDAFTLGGMALDQETSRDLEALDKKREMGLLSEQQYEKEKEKIQRSAFQKKKILDISQAIMNGALAITKAQAQTGALSPFVIPGIIAQTAGQVAIIAAQKYRKGGMFQDPLSGPSHEGGGMPVINPVSGQVQAELEGGEFITRKSSVNAATLPVLRAINETGRLPQVNYGQAAKFANGGMFGGGIDSGEILREMRALVAAQDRRIDRLTVSLPLRDLDDATERRDNVEKLANIA